MVVTLLWVGCSLASRRWLVRGRRAVWGEEQVFSFCTDNRWQMAGKLESFQTEEIFRGLCRWCLRTSKTVDSLAMIGRTWPFNRNQYSLNVAELNQQRESSLVNADSSSISSTLVKETFNDSVTEVFWGVPAVVKDVQVNRHWGYTFETNMGSQEVL